MKKLFIIGNGFDLFHELPTNVTDFTEILSEKDCNEYYEKIDIYWGEYERSLSYFDFEAMTELFLEHPNYLSDREGDREGVIFVMREKMEELHDIVKSSLLKMIENAEEIIDEKVNLSMWGPGDCKLVDKDNLFISFNYTSTLESLYEMAKSNKIIHIHGSVSEYDDLIFGYSDYNEKLLNSFAECGVDVANYHHTKGNGYIEIDYYTQKQYEEIFTFYDANKKNLQLEKLEKYLRSHASEIKEVIVLGHSMDSVDSKYFNLINDIVQPQKWIISQHNNNPCKEIIQNYTFVDIVEYCNIEDYVSKIL